MLAECIGGAITLLACLLPLVLCWRLLAGWRGGGSDEALGELLTIELAAESPSPLLPSPAAPSSPVDGYLPRRRGESDAPE